jgi:23S rRNA (pseudouridine1915-N3)-methyltransferase
MRWRVVTVGKPRLAHARAGLEFYLERIAPFAPITFEPVRATDPAREGAELLARTQGCFRVVLDESGSPLTTLAFAARLRGIIEDGSRICALIVGGANGLSQQTKASAGLLWSLGPLTLQHELAAVVACEQIYRAHTVLAGHPYHREGPH